MKVTGVMIFCEARVISKMHQYRIVKLGEKHYRIQKRAVWWPFWGYVRNVLGQPYEIGDLEICRLVVAAIRGERPQKPQIVKG